MSAGLPDALREAIERERSGISPRALAVATEELSTRYRAGHGHCRTAYLRSDADMVAYAVYRLPATVGAAHAALSEVQKRLPQWHPVSLLDIGAGPGSGAWAALEVWPTIEKVTLLEREPRMVELGRRLGAVAPHAGLREADWRLADVTADGGVDSADLILMSYVLGELAPEAREDIVRRQWEHCLGALVVVEPGTPMGYSIALDARRALLAAGGTTVAPCPHDLPCPMTGSDWCHFAARVPRSQGHRRAKGGRLGHEDEKFSYVAMSRLIGRPIAGRVIRHPQHGPGRVNLELSTPGGLAHRVVSRREGEAFRKARKLRWGDALEE